MKVYLETFGCQMNELDSELVRGQLLALGHAFVEAAEDADAILYNTCAVRDQAEQKVRSRIGVIGARKRQGEAVVLGVLGCMAEREGLEILRRYPQVDLLCGPGELDRLPLLLDNAARTERASVEERVALAGNRSRRTATLSAAEDGLEALDLARAFDPDPARKGWSAYVRITRGCNKFCTYCVVPATRGAEVHRPPDHIVEECRRLADSGVIEVTLLGQTVNHYRYEHGVAVAIDGREAPQVGPGLAAFRSPVPAGRRVTTFADLLRRIHEEVPALRRIRFVTSYPRDLGDDLFDCLAASPRICRYLHMPAQSGSDRILRLMNRGYTVSEYLETVDRAIGRLPDVTIAGDVIVGFPTETDEEFEATVALLRRVPFKNNFIFKYSPRPGTTAFDRLPDDVPDEVKRLRNNRLLAVQAEVSRAVHESWVGRTVEVLVEEIGPAPTPRAAIEAGGVELRWETAGPRAPASPDALQVRGRTGGDLITVLPLPASSDATCRPGQIVPVQIESAESLLLRGRRATAAALPCGT
jgi:tRNA-2-methylthio-N6-dimethylallyladenosine synthase